MFSIFVLKGNRTRVKMQVQSTSVEENFMFGSPPLLNGFTYNTCRSQEGIIHNTNHIDNFSTYNTNSSVELEPNNTCTDHQESEESCTSEESSSSSSPSTTTEEPTFSIMSSYCQQQPHYQRQQSKSLPNGFSKTTYSSYPGKNEQFYNTRANISEHNGTRTFDHHSGHLKLPKYNLNNEIPVFKKRKDLRVLKSVLSNERYREVVTKFGDGDEGGREIVESVHKSMRNSNMSHVTCLFCKSESQVYENFPIVDGTLFLSPIKLSRDCIKFDDKMDGLNTERNMCYVCVSCLEGKPKTLRCASCRQPWNGSFFQIGTLYSYNILSAIPCCEMKVKCKNCHEAIINLEKGEASTLFFSHFSSKSTCPSCHCEDFHYIKSLDTFTKTNSLIEAS